MMKYITAILMMALAFVASAANMASQPWVEMRLDQTKSLLIKTNEDFVASYVKSVGIANAAISIETNNVNSVTVGQGTANKMTVTWQNQTVRALMVANATADVQQYGITNRFIFVWDGNESYINGNGEMIVATTNCFRWHGIESFRTNRMDRFDGKFDVKGVLIQPVQAEAITNGLMTVSHKMSMFDIITSLFVGSAYAQEYTPAYVPDGWDDSAVLPSAKATYPGVEDLNFELGENGIIDKSQWNDDWKKTYDNPENLEFRIAVDAMQSALQAKAEIQEFAKDAIVKIESTTEDGKTSLKWYTNEGAKSGKGGTASGSASLRTYTVEADKNGVYQLKEDGTAKGSAWASMFADDKSLESYKDGSLYKTRLKGWNTHDLGSAFKIAEVLTADTEDTTSRVLVYNGGALQYWSLGKLDNGGSVKVDGASIVTNETEDGSASIAGFHNDASNGSVPFANGETLNWTGSPSAGAILGADENSTPKWTSTSGDNRYYGTGDNGSPLGWHNLPNVTTNYVEADEVSLTATIDGDKKTLKIKEIDSSQIYGRSGDEWVPIPGAATNGVAVKVDGVSVDTNGTDHALQIVGWKDHSGGFVMHGDGNKVAHKTVFADEELGGLEFYEDDADFGFNLEKWWDGYGGTCAENLGGILTGQITEADGDHLVLTRKNDGTLHYMKVGRVPSSPADGVTITTNNAGTAANKLAIAGAYNSENSGKVLSSTGSGTAWIAAGGGSALAFYGNDGTSATTPVIIGSGATTNAVTFASANDSNVKVTCTSDGEGGVEITIGVYYR